MCLVCASSMCHILYRIHIIHSRRVPLDPPTSRHRASPSRHRLRKRSRATSTSIVKDCAHARKCPWRARAIFTNTESLTMKEHHHVRRMLRDVVVVVVVVALSRAFSARASPSEIENARRFASLSCRVHYSASRRLHIRPLSFSFELPLCNLHTHKHTSRPCRTLHASCAALSRSRSGTHFPRSTSSRARVRAEVQRTHCD